VTLYFATAGRAYCTNSGRSRRPGEKARGPPRRRRALPAKNRRLRHFHCDSPARKSRLSDGRRLLDTRAPSTPLRDAFRVPGKKSLSGSRRLSTVVRRSTVRRSPHGRAHLQRGVSQPGAQALQAGVSVYRRCTRLTPARALSSTSPPCGTGLPHGGRAWYNPQRLDAGMRLALGDLRTRTRGLLLPGVGQPSRIFTAARTRAPSRLTLPTGKVMASRSLPAPPRGRQIRTGGACWRRWTRGRGPFRASHPQREISPLGLRVDAAKPGKVRVSCDLPTGRNPGWEHRLRTGEPDRVATSGGGLVFAGRVKPCVVVRDRGLGSDRHASRSRCMRPGNDRVMLMG